MKYLIRAVYLQVVLKQNKKLHKASQQLELYTYRSMEKQYIEGVQNSKRIGKR